MGHSASAAFLFKALSQEKDNKLLTQARIATSKFSLFAIILADPEKDPIFYESLQQDFAYFDRLTGKNFLFFAIVKEAGKSRFKKYHNLLKIVFDSDGYRQNNAAEEVNHSELVIHAICTVLGISYDETPSLIISNDLQFGQFCKINTSVDRLEEQLKELSRLADYLTKNSLTKSLAGLLHKVNEQNNCFGEIESLEKNEKIIGIVSEILQAVSKDKLFDNTTIKKLQSGFQISQESLPLSSEKIIETLALLNTRNELNILEGHTRPDTKSIVLHDLKPLAFRIPDITAILQNEWKMVQPSTIHYLKTCSILNNAMDSFWGEIGDYSTYTLPLCKSFETEINLSIVQLMRKKLGIVMPTFFAKYCPVKDNLPVMPSTEIVSHPRPIFLNGMRNNKWLEPGMGESRLAFATLRKQSPAFGTEWQSEENLNHLIDQWGKIQKVRNLTAHSSPVLENDRQLLQESLMALHKNDLLNSLTKLKDQLSH